jgi:hypothetical protein
LTVIAWDGTTLAADKRMVNFSMISTVTKIFRLDDALVGFTGQAGKMGQYLAWMKAGFDPLTYPEQDKENTCYGLVVRRGGVIQHYQNTGYPVVIEDRLYAEGAGREAALAAMHLGCTDE